MTAGKINASGSVHVQGISATCDRILMKLSGMIRLVSVRNRLYFGEDVDIFVDPMAVFIKRHSTTKVVRIFVRTS